MAPKMRKRRELGGAIIFGKLYLGPLSAKPGRRRGGEVRAYSRHRAQDTKTNGGESREKKATKNKQH
ncbi:hypothetical protein RRF57_007864 [Xylaria bambusicola]|uniref:Uncharacterized protein n=1 Tax=Xylaria bambusicola TaxID=326684 RepID=A0AAN7ZAP2_9PEZI